MKELLKAAIIGGGGYWLFAAGFVFPAGVVAGWLLFWLVANLRVVFDV